LPEKDKTEEGRRDGARKIRTERASFSFKFTPASLLGRPLKEKEDENQQFCGGRKNKENLGASEPILRSFWGIALRNGKTSEQLDKRKP